MIDLNASPAGLVFGPALLGMGLFGLLERPSDARRRQAA